MLFLQFQHPNDRNKLIFDVYLTARHLLRLLSIGELPPHKNIHVTVNN